MSRLIDMPSAPAHARPRPERAAPAAPRGHRLGLVELVAGVVVVAVVYGWSVWVSPARHLDIRLQHEAMVLDDTSVERLKLVLDTLVGAGVMSALLVTLAAWRAGRRHQAITSGAIIVGAQALSETLKAALPAPGGLANTLPSGHVTIAITTAVVLGAWWRRRRRAALALGLSLLGTVVPGVVIVGWHRPSDVLAAVGVVLIVTGLTSLVGHRARSCPPLAAPADCSP